MRDQTLHNAFPLYAQIRRGELPDDEAFVVLLSLFGAMVDQMAADEGEGEALRRLKTLLPRVHGFSNCVWHQLEDFGVSTDEVKRLYAAGPVNYPEMPETDMLRRMFNRGK